MLYRMERLIGMSIQASDGEIGRLVDVYFDERRWTARYLLIECGGWLRARRLLVSPIAVRSINWEQRRLLIGLDREQLGTSPLIDTRLPLPPAEERVLREHYGYPDYRIGGQRWGRTPYPLIPAALPAGLAQDLAPARPPRAELPALGSLRELHGYSVQTVDAAVGHLEEFLIDSSSWAMPYLVLGMHRWWSGRQVVIPPQWIRKIDPEQKLLRLSATRQAVQDAPEFDPSPGHARPYETNLYKHYHGAEYPLSASPPRPSAGADGGGRHPLMPSSPSGQGSRPAPAP